MGFPTEKIESTPEAVIDSRLLLEAIERLERGKGKPTVPIAGSMAEFGIVEAGVDAAEDPEIE